MKKTIVHREPKFDLNQLKDLHPVLQRVYSARDIQSQEDLERSLQGLISFESLKGIDKACQRLHEAIAKQQRILIIGDFDADGATSTALAVSALTAFGSRNIDYLVPNRFTYGYGLSPEIVEVAKQKNPDVIITVDNGIASHAGVERANEYGIDVIVTDHHLPADTLPDAFAIVNPNQPGDDFPSKCLAGVGVIFYVMLALRRYLTEQGWFESQNIEVTNMAQFLDLVALGTVADVVPLDKNNRILVHQGINRIRAGQARPGISALLEVAGKDYSRVVSTDLGFIVGPRLNAAGRLDDMAFGIACLLAKDKLDARQRAHQLNDLNRERRAIEAQMQKEAFDIVDELNLDQQLPFGLCLFREDWHQGVVGLVASRVKEKVHRPVIAFAKVDDNTLKGSARSIYGVHIRDVLDSIATEHPEILSKFGGHAMAAGLSIDIENFKTFSDLFAKEIERRVEKDDLQGRIETDGKLQQEEFTLELAELLRGSGPWGQGFPEPSFDGEFRIIEQRIVGNRHLKLVLQIPNSDVYLDGIAFNVDLDKWPNSRVEQAHFAYRLDVNAFNRRKKLQLVVEEIL